MVITPETSISDLKLPYTATILAELFFIFPDEPQPKTVCELAMATCLSVEKSLAMLQEVIIAAGEVSLTRQEWQITAQKDRCLIIDCSLPSLRIKNSLTLEDLEDERVFAALKDDRKIVICVCKDGKRSFSAAMQLLNLGVRKARHLSGGLNCLEHNP